MFRVFINTFKVSYAEGVNSFIYILSKLPVIGKFIPDKIYKETGIKVGLGVISTILGLFTKLFKKSLYLFLLIIVPILFITRALDVELDKVEAFFHIFFILSFILGSLSNTVLSKTDKVAFNMIKLMRVDAKKFYLGQIIYEIILQWVFFTPVMIVWVGITNIFTILLLFSCFRLIGEAFVLYVFEKYRFVLSKSKFILAIAIIGLPIVAYISTYFKILIPMKIFIMPLTLIFILIMGITSFYYLYKSEEYTSYSNRVLSRAEIFGQLELLKDIQFKDVKIDEKKLNKDELDSNKYNNKNGYDYLNAIFFNRHRKIAVNAIRNRVLALLIAMIIALFVILFVPKGKDIVGLILNRSSSGILFIMYLLSTTERICKGMFFNCDVSLLRYGYYKESKSILANFTIRLKKIIMYNLIPAATLCIAMIILMVAIGDVENILSLIPTLVSVVSLSVFFSIYHLFMYYIIQPYTKDLTIKSPVFHGANFVIYMIAYNTMGKNMDPQIYAYVLIAITTVFVPMALVTVYRISPRTFRLK